MYLLSDKLIFPPVHLANEDGILAIGGDLSVKRLLLAYKNGIFPWYNKGEPIIWYCPQKRMVLKPGQLKVSKSMRKILNKNEFSITLNKNFDSVIRACKTIKRNEDFGTWITDEMEQAYIKLNKIGIAKSVEVWKNNKLVGGLYGVDLGTVFCGESMFSFEPNASKVAFIHLAEKLFGLNYSIIDCQVYNQHLASLGAKEISKEEFIEYLKTIH